MVRVNMPPKNTRTVRSTVTKVTSKRQTTETLEGTAAKRGHHKLQQVDPNLHVTVTNDTTATAASVMTVQANNQSALTVQLSSGQQAPFLGYPALGPQQTNLQQSAVLTMWLAMWNPMQGQYIMNPGLVLAQVPWMSMGPSQTWAPAQYPWAIPQVSPPPQASSLLLNLANTGALSQLMQQQTQSTTQMPVPVTTTTVKTTMPTGAQPPTPIPATMMNALSVQDVAGNFQLKIANHIPVAIRNKIWQYQYIDLGSLINTDNMPDEVTYDFSLVMMRIRLVLKLPNCMEKSSITQHGIKLLEF